MNLTRKLNPRAPRMNKKGYHHPVQEAAKRPTKAPARTENKRRRFMVLAVYASRKNQAIYTGKRILLGSVSAEPARLLPNRGMFNAKKMAANKPPTFPAIFRPMKKMGINERAMITTGKRYTARINDTSESKILRRV